MTTRKTGYFISPEFENDIFIPFNNLNKALHGDTIKVYVYNRRSNRRPEAEVIEIIKRKIHKFRFNLF